MKAIHVCHSFEYGGITTFVQSLLDLNTDFGSQHDLLVWQKSSGTDPSLYHVVDLSKSTHRKIQFENTVKKYDLIFVHSLHPFMLQALQTLRNKVFLFQHGMTFGSNILKRAYRFALFSSAINLLGHSVIYSSSFAFEKLQKKLLLVKKDHAHIIPFGINLPSNPIDIPFPHNKKIVIGAAGRLVDQKRFHLVLSALQQIKTEQKIEFRIAGDGPEKETLLGKSNELPGFVTFSLPGRTADMESFYSEIDLFIHPGEGESYGLVVLEALARHIPVIVFDDSGACVEFIQNGINGFIVRSVTELAERINALTDSKYLNQIKNQMAQENSIAHYDIRKTRRKLDQLQSNSTQ